MEEKWRNNHFSSISVPFTADRLGRLNDITP